MKVALVRVSSYQSWYKTPSIGLGYIAGMLEREGIGLKIFDARYFNISDNNLIEDIQNFSPDIVGFSAMTNEIKRTARIADALKRKLNVSIIVGGCHITALPIRTLEEFPAIDYGVIGEGDFTLVDIVKHMNGSVKIEDIEGIVYRSNSKVIQNEARKPIMDLDSLPFPAFHHYFRHGNKSLRHRNLYYQLFTSRGCPFNCAFCMRVLGKTPRRRSPESIIDEINFVIKEYGAHTINFADEIFLFNNEKTKEILYRFIQKGISKKIRWSGQTRIDLVDKELTNLAKKAGCYRLEVGIESGNNDILKRINKNITVEKIESSISIIKEEGIKVATYYILGHPGENRETIRETIDLAVKLNTDTIAVGIMVPYPGTKIYEWAQQSSYGYRLRSVDWDDYDKFGNSALEIEGLPASELEDFQRKAYLYFYLRNLRMIDLLRFVISRYKGILAVLKRQISRRS